MSLRSVGRAFDWIGVRLAIAVAIGLTAFVVLQPLIWSEVLHKEPPAGVADLASLTAVMVTIMSLGLAAFGVVSFQLVEKRVERDLQDRATTLREALEKQAAKAAARLYLNISFQAFLTYDDRWSSASPPYTWETAKDPDFREILEHALKNAVEALGVLEALPGHLLDDQETKTGIQACKSQVAFFLATRRQPEDRDKALKYVREIDSPSVPWEYQETIAWVRLCYSSPGDDEWREGLRALGAFMARGDVPSQIRTKSRVKYAALFEGGPGIEEALAAGEPEEPVDDE